MNAGPAGIRSMADNHLGEFEQRLASLWDAGFAHSFEITGHHSWRRWRDHTACNNREVWVCGSLKDAADRYSWSERSNEPSFEELSTTLIDHVANGRDKEAYAACLAIFKWGGVARSTGDRSVRWLTRYLDDGKSSSNLSQILMLGRDILCGKSQGIDKFNGCDLIMNSAMTKVFAAIAPDDLIIYDGRVGAALGLLARDYLDTIGHDDLPPNELAFSWGSSRRKHKSGFQNERNPSRGVMRFPPLFGTHPDLAHAKMMRHASSSLKRVSSLIGAGSAEVFRDLEKSLFMIGYDVSRTVISR